jgi:predicted DNA-binding transcriptional regulator YafY
MSFSTNIQRIQQMDQLIRLKSTGTSLEFAKRIGIGRTTLFELLHIMQDMGAQISYDRKSKTYFYQGTVKFRIGFMPISQ